MFGSIFNLAEENLEKTIADLERAAHLKRKIFNDVVAVSTLRRTMLLHEFLEEFCQNGDDFLKNNVSSFCNDRPLTLLVEMEEQCGTDSWGGSISFPEWFKLGVGEQGFAEFSPWHLYVIAEGTCSFEEWRKAVMRTVRQKCRDFFCTQMNIQNQWFLEETLVRMEEDFEDILWRWEVDWIFAPAYDIAEKSRCNEAGACNNCALRDNCGHFFRN